GSSAFAKAAARRRFAAGPFHAVDEQDVRPAVGVVVDERASRAERFGKQLAAIRAAHVTELKTRRCRDVDELKADAGRLCEERGGECRERRADAATFQERSTIHRRVIIAGSPG